MALVLLIFAGGCSLSKGNRTTTQGVVTADDVSDDTLAEDLSDEPILEVVIDDATGLEDVFFLVDKKPEFPGGRHGLLAFYRQSSTYEIVEEEAGTSSVYYRIIIEPDGSVSNFKILERQVEALNEETRRIVSMMPDWEPGIKDGKPVRVLINLSINYQI